MKINRPGGFGNMFNDCFKNKNVLVTGHTGFKGSWLTQWLLELGANVTGISVNIPTNPSLFEALELSKYITDIRLDIKDQEKLTETILTSQPDFIFHLAAQPIVSESYNNPLETIQTNVIGTTNMLYAINKLEHNCTSIIITSDKCYENVEWEWGYKETDKLGGKDIYSGSKAAAEIVFHCFYHSFLKKNCSQRVATARAGNVIGGGDWAANRIIPDCVRAWSNNQKVTIRSPQATRPWQHVLEPLSGYLLLASALSKDTKLNGESFNFGPDSNNNINVVEIISDLYKRWKPESKESGYTIEGNTPFHEAGLLKLNCDKAYFHLRWKPNLIYPELIEFTGDWYFNFYHGNTDIKEFTKNQIEQYTQKALTNNLIWASNN